MLLKGKTYRKWRNGQNIMILKIKLTPWVHLSLPWGCIHVSKNNSQTSLWVSLVNVYRTIGPLVFNWDK